MQACLSRAGNEDLRGLVEVLQQSGCYSISRNSRENESVLHQARC